jgi:hypothetical protein
MRGPILFVCLLALFSGCRDGASTSTEKKSAQGDGGRKDLARDAAPVDVAKDFLVGSGFGPDIQVVSSEEKPVTLDKKPAVALHLQWRGTGNEQRNDLFLTQDQRVKDFSPYDASKSLEENAAAAARKLETP